MRAVGHPPHATQVPWPLLRFVGWPRAFATTMVVAPFRCNEWLRLDDQKNKKTKNAQPSICVGLSAG